MEDSTTHLDKALWRYGIICPLLHRQVNGLTLTENLEQLADRTGTPVAAVRKLTPSNPHDTIPGNHTEFQQRMGHPRFLGIRSKQTTNSICQ